MSNRFCFKKIFKCIWLTIKQMKDKIIIAGIDPGTTTAYAAVDINGELLDKKSSRELNLNSVIYELTSLGKVVAVGTDKAKIPGFIEAFSSKTGAITIKPPQDMKVNDKKEIVRGYKPKDCHESDALACALFAYNNLENLINKIKRFSSENHKKEIINKIASLVITKKISIRDAADIIEKPGQKEVKIIKKVVEEKKLNKEDFMIMYEKLKRKDKENRFLKKQNKKLKHLLDYSKERYNYIITKAIKTNNDKKSNELLRIRDRRIRLLADEVKSKQKEINRLKEQIHDINSMLAKTNKYYVLKKIKNLSLKEFEDKKRLLDIGKNDILLVENINLFNNKVIEEIKGEVQIICHNKKPNNSAKKLPFLFIHCKDIIDLESEYFGLVKKSAIHNKIREQDIISKVLREYKEERATNLYN